MALVALALSGGGLSYPAVARSFERQVLPEIKALAPTDGATEQSEPALQPDEPEHAYHQPSGSTQQLIEWVKATRDNGDWPFIVIDKVAAAAFAYDANGEMLAAAPVLLGMAQGDDSTPGIGKKSLSKMGPAEKTTPAGRFVARVGRAAGNKKVLWVDYSTSVALHPVVTANRKEKRLERLKSATPDDNRITFGCINVLPSFFRDVIRPNFSDTSGIVYILPDTKHLIEVFPAFQIAQQTAPTPKVSLSVTAAK